MTSLNFFNTASRRLEKFEPLKGKEVGLYSCGPTVYDFPHLGNLRSYLFVDLLVKVLEKIGGYKVKWVMNITDIDDKTIQAAKKAKVSLKEITIPLEKAFFKDLETLGIETAKIKKVRATEHFKEMKELLRVLKKRGFAYQAPDGSWYYSIKKFKDYGKFAGLSPQDLKPGARVSQDEYQKETPADFALWKFGPESKKGSPFDFAQGRPGWHLECSAMSVKYLGQPFDIHTGGVDLIFPHHQNEIAQTEGATGKKLANYWLHNEHLLLKGKKIAKSKGNVIYLRELLKKFHSMTIRYFLLSAHYRSKLDFTDESLVDARESLSSIQRGAWQAKKQTGDWKLIADFNRALVNDLNTPKALAIIHQNLQDEGIGFFRHINQLLGLNLHLRGDGSLPESEIKKGLEGREKIRARGDFKKADKLRRILEQKYSIEILDTSQGPQYSPKYVYSH